MRRVLETLREQVGEAAFLEELQRYGWTSIDDIRAQFGRPDLRKATAQKAVQAYHHLAYLVEGGNQAVA